MEKLKVKQLSNRELIESLFEQMEKELNVHIENISFGNSYFVFEGEDDSVCHFNIKEIRGFRFAVWNTNRFDSIEKLESEHKRTWAEVYDIDRDSELIFFTQYERDLDKFKPSRSGFITGLKRIIYTEQANDEPEERIVEEWDFYRFEDIIHYMRKHHIKSVLYAGAQTRYVWEELSWIYCFNRFIKDWIYELRYRHKERRRHNKELRRLYRFTNKLTQFNYAIRDMGDCFYPRYNMIIRRKDNYSEVKYAEESLLLDHYIDSTFTKNGKDVCVDWLEGNEDEESFEEVDMECKHRFERMVKRIYEVLYPVAPDDVDGERLLKTNIDWGDVVWKSLLEDQNKQ